MWLAEAAGAVRDAWPWFWPLVGGVLGGVLGSFAACWADRSQRGMSLRYPPSECASCHARLKAPDLVPVFSWLILRGKCRHCGARIPVSAWVVETGCAVAGALLACFLINS